VDPYQHQAKDVFAEHGVPVPHAIVAEASQQARASAGQLIVRAVVMPRLAIGRQANAAGIELAMDHAGAEATRLRQVPDVDGRGLTVRKVIPVGIVELADDRCVPCRLDRATDTFPALATTEGVGVEWCRPAGGSRPSRTLFRGSASVIGWRLHPGDRYRASATRAASVRVRDPPTDLTRAALRVSNCRRASRTPRRMCHGD
jgi:hypothetical protein